MIDYSSYIKTFFLALIALCINTACHAQNQPPVEKIEAITARPDINPNKAKAFDRSRFQSANIADIAFELIDKKAFVISLRHITYIALKLRTSKP